MTVSFSTMQLSDQEVNHVVSISLYTAVEYNKMVELVCQAFWEGQSSLYCNVIHVVILILCLFFIVMFIIL